MAGHMQSQNYGVRRSCGSGACFCRVSGTCRGLGKVSGGCLSVLNNDGPCRGCVFRLHGASSLLLSEYALTKRESVQEISVARSPWNPTPPAPPRGSGIGTELAADKCCRLSQKTEAWRS